MNRYVISFNPTYWFFSLLPVVILTKNLWSNSNLMSFLSWLMTWDMGTLESMVN